MKEQESIELLKEFAKEKGIDEKEVDIFMESRNHPKTLNDVINMPSDLKTHYSSISYLPETLRAFVDKEMDYIERHRIIDSDSLIEKWCDCAYFIIVGEDVDEDLWCYTLDELLSLKSQEDKKEELDFLKEVAKEIFELKFGSFKNDW